MHRRQLDAKGVKRRGERSDKGVEPLELGEAVADTGGQRAPIGIADPHLILQRGERLVAEFRQSSQNASKHLATGELARAVVEPARCCQTDSPARPPGQIVERARIGPDEQVGRAGADTERRVIGDWCVGWIKGQQEIGHYRAMSQGCLEGRWPERLGTDRTVDVGYSDEGERVSPARELGRQRRVDSLHDLGGRIDTVHRDIGAAAGDRASSRPMTRSTLEMVAAKRSIIWASSSSVLVNAGASRTSSPAKPSSVECVDVTSRPSSNAVSSTSEAASNSWGRKDFPSRGSTSSTPRRKPRPRTAPTIVEPPSAAASSS